MNRSLIFITVLLTATSFCSANLLPSREMLGVGSCYAEQIKRVSKFLDDNLFVGLSVKPNIYYHDCDFVTSPSEDSHKYTTTVSLNGVECALTFFTGHYDQDITILSKDPEVQHRIQECRAKLEADMPSLQDEEPVIREEEVVLPKELAVPSLSAEEIQELKHQLFKKMQADAKEAGRAVREAREARRAVRDARVGMSEESYNYAIRKLFKVVEEHRANPEDPDYSETFHDLFAVPEPTPEETQKEEEIITFMAQTAEPVEATPFVDELDRNIREPVMGGMNKCNSATKLHLKNLLVNLMNQGVFRGFVVYSENIVECEAQVVNGMNYKAVVSFNGKERCPLQVYEHFSGSVTLKNDMALAQDRVCGGYLTHATYMKLSGEIGQRDGQ